MNKNMCPSDHLQGVARAAMTSLADFTDATCKVWLVEEDFNPAIATTYPAHSAAFAAVTGAAGGWELIFDAMTLEWFVVAREPAEGWDFVSIDDGVSIVGYIVELATDTDTKIGGNKFENPISITATGQHVMLPYVSFPVTNLFGNVPIPQTET